MKRLSTYLIIIIYVFLVACSDGKSDYKIGVSQCSEGRWRTKVNQEMLAAQHLYEKDVKVTIANSYDDPALQARQIDSLILTGIDLLVVAPNEDSQTINEAIARVRQRGIPVVFFDRKTSYDDYTAFIGGNNVEAGQVAGRYAAQLEGNRVLEITGAMSSSPAKERHQGFSEVMKSQQAKDYQCQYGDWTSEEAYRIVAEQISDGQRPDIVFCHNDGMATGVYKAVVEAGQEGAVKILGIDGMPGEGLEYVKLGHQVGTYVYPTHGELIVRLALDILEARPYEREQRLQSTMVTPENVDLIAMNAAEMMVQNSHLVTIQDKLEAYFGLYDTQRTALWVLGVGCLVLIVALMAIWRAYIQTRRTIRKRQELNEEQTLFYTDAGRRKVAEIFSTPQEELPQPKSQDVLFAEQLNEAIREKMSNPSLKVDDLGESMGLSRVQLYRRVKAVTGLTPVELLRQMRLQQGYALLCTTTKTVQEIAYEVGFGTPGYFSKCFKQQYGKYPMDLRQNRPSGQI